MKTMIAILPAAAAAAVVSGCDKTDRKEMVPGSTDFGTGLNAVEKTYARPAKDVVDVVPAMGRCTFEPMKPVR